MYTFDIVKKSHSNQSSPSNGAWEFMPHIINHSNWRYDLKNLVEFSSSHNWDLKFNFEKELDKGNKAVVITDIDQTIQYVNFYFEKMTGYSREETFGRKPRFLQGPETDQNTKRKIRESLSQEKEVKATILNYRKDQQSYLCRVKIYPIFNRDQVLINYMAIEREVAA